MTYSMKGSPMLRNFGIGASPVKQGFSNPHGMENANLKSDQSRGRANAKINKKLRESGEIEKQGTIMSKGNPGAKPTMDEL